MVIVKIVEEVVRISGFNKPNGVPPMFLRVDDGIENTTSWRWQMTTHVGGSVSMISILIL